MKHLKTTIKLSVLALACFGAGALALQPTAYAKAEDGAGCVTMQNGAAVCVSDDFSGIRWTSNIDFDKYQMLCGAGKTITFGTLVMPTDALGEDNELTEADKDAVDIIANVDVNNIAGNTEYYSIINYENLADAFTDEATREESLKKAYALELTARSYVKVNDTYYFADMTGISTSRSARQVALAAELAGEWTDEDAAKAKRAATYYGMTERYVPTEVSNGAAGTAFIDLAGGAMPTQEVEMNVDLEGEVESIFIGAERVEFVSYVTDESTKTLTFKVNEGQPVPTGETYVTIFTDSGFYTKPIIGATMVFDSFDDFDVFAKIRENMSQSTKDGEPIDQWKISSVMQGDNVASDYEFDGYYVLGKSLAWDAEKDTAKADEGLDHTVSGWRGTSEFAKTKLGLTGTFNGLGRTIKGYQDARSYSGLFQLVNGGTIKNVYMYAYTPSVTTDETTTYTKYTQNFAHYMIDPTIENVFIYSNKKFSAQHYQYILGNYLYQTEENAAKLSNIYVKLTYGNTKASANRGGLFSNYSGETQNEYNWSNVYVACNLGVSYAGVTKSYIDVNGTEKAAYIPTFKAYAENQKTENGYTYYDPNYKGAPVELTLTEGGMTGVLTYSDVAYNVYSTSGDATSTTLTAPATAPCLNGVYVYYDAAAFNAAAPNLDFSGFTGVEGGNCWTVSDAGVLTWGN